MLIGGTVLVLLLLGAWVSLVSVFGGLPEEAQRLPEMEQYRAIAARLHVPCRSSVGSAHQVTPGILMALDILTGNKNPALLEEAGKLLRPEFTYAKKSFTVKDLVSGENTTVSVRILKHVYAYDGRYSYEYSYEVSGASVRAILEHKKWVEDYSRIRDAVEVLTGQRPDEDTAVVIARLGKNIDSGTPDLQALVPSFLQGATYSGGSWPVQGKVTSGYGWRIHPITGELEFHSGVDIAAPSGTPIRPTAGGTVTLAGHYGGYGLCVVIDHGGGLQTLYGHCSEILVYKGEHVEAGQVIARVGSTGTSTGPHLHYEVRKDGVCVDPRTISF